MILYPLSSDPFHKGHYNIQQKATKTLSQEVAFLLVQSPAKDEGLLNITERYKDMLITLFCYGVKDGTITRKNKAQKRQEIKAKIHIAQSKEQIYTLMDQATHLVRGFRNTEDKTYSLELLKSIGNPAWLHKSSRIEQDEFFREISSTKYKAAYYENLGQIGTLPHIYNFLEMNRIVRGCKEVNEDHPLPYTINQRLGNEIKEYFSLVDEIEHSGYFTGLPR